VEPRYHATGWGAPYTAGSEVGKSVT
jgi:hypothetical protein